MNIDQDNGEVKSGRSTRFTLWSSFLVFSTIVMGASVGEKNKYNEHTANSTWAVTASAITFTLTLVVVALQMSSKSSSYIVGTKVEGVIILVLAAFWTSIVAVVSNASNGVAVNPELDNTIDNGNLYYFSWAGFVTSVLLGVDYLKSLFGLDIADEIQSRAARLSFWASLLACQLVVMGSSANIFEMDCLPQTQSDAYCSITKFGIALGCMGTLVTLGIVSIKMVTTVAPFLIEGVLSLLLSIMNGFGVAFITSADGPGAPIGNLYYFTWLSFLSSGFIVSKCYEDYRTPVSLNESAAEHPDEFPDRIRDADDI